MIDNLEYQSVEFKQGYCHGLLDGEQREWERWQTMLKNEKSKKSSVNDYPQAQEDNEFRYLSPAWLNEIAIGLTAGAKAHPGETWREIPAKEHAWRAIRHLILFLMGDKEDKHLINAAMRVMMAFETDKAANDVIEWERLGREKGVM